MGFPGDGNLLPSFPLGLVSRVLRSHPLVAADTRRLDRHRRNVEHCRTDAEFLSTPCGSGVPFRILDSARLLLRRLDGGGVSVNQPDRFRFEPTTVGSERNAMRYSFTSGDS